jgi:hypothetical protein
LVYAENLSPLNFPAQQVLDRLKQIQDTLDSVTKLTLTAIQERPFVAEFKGTDPYETPEVLEAIVEVLKLSYWSRHEEEVLNEKVHGKSQAALNSLPRLWICHPSTCLVSEGVS